jgi:hypothetical protein
MKQSQEEQSDLVNSNHVRPQQMRKGFEIKQD